MIDFELIRSCFPTKPSADTPVWTDGTQLLAKNESLANALADTLDSLGYVAVTGYYDPAEDKRNGETDRLTGYYYVDV